MPVSRQIIRTVGVYFFIINSPGTMTYLTSKLEVLAVYTYYLLRSERAMYQNPC
jgi:hypothetical protein